MPADYVQVYDANQIAADLRLRNLLIGGSVSNLTATVQYLGVGTLTTVEAYGQVRMERPGTVRAFRYVKNADAAENVTVTVRKNSADTALTDTHAGAGTRRILADVPFAVNDLFSAFGVRPAGSGVHQIRRLDLEVEWA